MRELREKREAMNAILEAAKLASGFHRLAALSQLSHAEKNQEKRQIKKTLWDQGAQIILLQFGLFTWLSLILVTL